MKSKRTFDRVDGSWNEIVWFFFFIFVSYRLFWCEFLTFSKHTQHFCIVHIFVHRCCCSSQRMYLERKWSQIVAVFFSSAALDECQFHFEFKQYSFSVSHQFECYVRVHLLDFKHNKSKQKEQKKNKINGKRNSIKMYIIYGKEEHS